MRRLAWVLGYLMALVLLGTGEAYAAHRAEHGVLDAAGWSPNQILSLEGEWEFYWDEILEPRTYLERLQKGHAGQHFARIGERFREANPGTATHDQGYATYALRLRNLPSGPLGMARISLYTSGRVFFFSSDGGGWDKPVMEMGRLGTSLESTTPSFRERDVAILESVEGRDYYLLVQVANFHHAWGGFWQAPVIAAPQIVMRDLERSGEFNFWLIGVLFFIGVYNLSFYLRRPEDKGSLYLSLTVLFVTARLFFIAGASAIIEHKSGLVFELSFKIIYLSLLLPALTFASFLRSYFPSQTPARAIRLGWLLAALPLLLILLTPTRIFSAYSAPIESMMAMAVIYLSICLGKAALAKEVGALYSLAGCLSLIVGIALDLAYKLGANFLPFNSTGIGLIVFMGCQSQIVAARFATAFRRSEQLGRDLQKEVDRQTREIKAILRNIRQGIFTVVGPDKKIGPLYSQHLAEIMQQPRIEGRHVREFLLDPSDLDDDQKAVIEACLDASFKETLLAFDLNAGNLVHELRYSARPQEVTKQLEIDWAPMPGEDGLIDQVLVSIRDVSEISNLRIQAKKQEDDLRILIELIQIPEDKVQRFMSNARQYLQENRHLIENTKVPAQDIIRKLFVNIHTIKGSARTYALHGIAAASHGIEQAYNDLTKDPRIWNAKALLDDLTRLDLIFARYQAIGESRLGWNRETRMVRMSSKDMKAIIEDLQQITPRMLPDHARAGFLRALESLLTTSFARLDGIVDEASKGLPSIARDLQKIPPRIKVAGGSCMLREAAADCLFNCLVHLFRNSLDHGIEPPAERMEKGKTAEGMIELTAELSSSSLTIRYQDDGRGLNLEAIEKKGRDSGILSSERNPEPHEIAMLIFATGFSTKSSVSEISGRGVGMDAVRMLIEEIGGRIHLTLGEVHVLHAVPFSLELEVPGSHLYAVSHESHAAA